MSLLDKLKKDKPEVKKTTKAATVSKKEETAKTESMQDLYGGGSEIKATTGTAKAKKDKKFGNAYRVLVKPVITERAAHLGTENKYVFAVKPETNKIEVAKAIQEVYGIKPVSVNVITMRGKKVRFGKRKGERKGWKKAIVTLPAGKTINIYEGV